MWAEEIQMSLTEQQEGFTTTEWWEKFKLECLLICTYINANFLVICKPWTVNDGGEDSVKYRNRKKHCFLAAAIYFGNVIITW